jgi:hypothetical protein
VTSNSRGPETLSALVAGPQLRTRAAKAGDLIVVTIPLKNYRAENDFSSSRKFLNGFRRDKK